MRKIFPVLALSLGLTAPATAADAGPVQYGKDLRFVAETTLPSPDGQGTMSLCHLVSFADFFFVPVYTSIQSYALSGDSCSGQTYRELTSAEVENFKAGGMINAGLPTAPSVDLKALAWGHAWLLLIGFAIFLRAIGAISGGGKRSKRGAPDTLAIHSLVAMSQVAIADGRIDDAEVHEIANILTRLTGQSYAPSQVMDMLEKLDPSTADLAQVGQDLSEKDREIVLEAALNIAVADGEIHPNEYAVVSELAQRMRIGADQFRSAMARISAHLQTVAAP